MKAFKSMVLLTVGVLAISACDKRNDNQTTSTGTDPNVNSMTNTAPAVTTEAGIGTGAATGATTQDDFSTSEGSGAISDETEINELNSETDSGNFPDEDLSGSEVEEEQYTPVTEGTGSGIERSGDNYESVDESSSEPDDVRGGRDARMVPKNNEIDNTSSEPDLEQ